jgi:hypothetical protein
VRVEGEEVHFVASTALTDRLVFAEEGANLRVSNSLALLLAVTGASLDPTHEYRAESGFLAAGLDRYERRFRVRHPRGITFGQFYHESLVLSPRGIEFRSRGQIHEFPTFAAYRSALRGAVHALMTNARNPKRRWMFTPYTSASAGYDSAGVSVLAREAGTEFCYSKRRSNSSVLSGSISDDGTPIARLLGYETRELRSGRMARHEVLFRAVSRVSPELAFDTLMEEIRESGRLGVVFTGFYGDTMWGIASDRDEAAQMRWPSPSGLSLGEVRLHAGAVHVAVPFLFGRSGASIARISRSEEMLPWRVGGDYDRPIPRRILEEAGVPREWFGRRKRAILDHDTDPVSPQARTSFFGWLLANTEHHPSEIVRYRWGNRAAFLLHGIVFTILDRLRRTSTPSPRDALWSDLDPQGLMFRWAVETVVDDYRGRIPSGTPSATAGEV